MDEYLQNLLTWANDALRRGASEADVNKIIMEQTGGKLNLGILRHVFTASQEAERAASAPQASRRIDPRALEQAQRGMPSDSVRPMPTKEEIKEYEDRSYLAQLYEWAQAQMEQGAKMADVNKVIHEQTDGKIPGVASLELELGIEEDIEFGDIPRGKAFGTGFTQGVTFGFSDEIIARIQSLHPDIDYDDAVKIARAYQDQARDEHKVAYTIGELGGAAVPALATGGLTAPASGARVGVPLLRQGVQAIPRMTGIGAAEGALYGAGTAEGGLLNRARGVAGGAAVGAGAGGVMGFLAPFGGAALRASGRRLNAALGEPSIRNPFRSRDPAGAFSYETPRGAVVPPPQTVRPSPSLQQQRLQGGRILREANLPTGDPERAAGVLGRQMADAPPGTVLADINPTLRTEARARANEVGGLLADEVEKIATREAQSGSRIVNKLREMTGIHISGAEFKGSVKRKIAAVRELMYNELEKRYPVIAHPEVQRVLSQPEFAAILRAEGINLSERGGAVTMTEIQAIRGRLAAKLKGQRNPNTFQRAKRMKESLDAAMDIAVPEFRVANRAYRHAQDRIRAYKSGQQAASKTGQDAIEMLEQVPEHARHAFKLGMLTRLESRLLKHEAGGAARTSLLKAGDDLHTVVRQMFPEGPRGNKAFNDFIESLEWEKRFRSTYRELTGGGVHARQQRGTIDEVAEQATRGDSLFGTVREIMGTMFSGREAREDAAEVIGRLLLSEGEDAAWNAAYALSRIPPQHRGQAIAQMLVVLKTEQVYGDPVGQTIADIGGGLLDVGGE